MIIKGLSDFVSVDEIINENNKKYVHFITHYDQCFVVQNNWRSLIYTSDYLAKCLSTKKTPIPHRYLRILGENEEQVIDLKDGTSITVRMFINAELHGSVVFYFERKDTSQKVLYCGPFLECRPLLLSPAFRHCVLNGVDDMYVDNTRARSADFETIETVASFVASLLKKHPGHLIMLNVPIFGHEELLYLLATEHDCKIYVEEAILRIIKKFDSIKNRFTSNIQEANIVVGEEQLNFEKLSCRFSNNGLTVVLMECNDTPKNFFTNCGLYVVHWSPHPSLFQLNTLVYFVQPRKLHGTDASLPPLPRCLTSLCIRNARSKVPETIESLVVEEVDDVFEASQVTETMTLSASRFLSTQTRNKTDLPRNIAKRRERNRIDLSTLPIAIIKPVASSIEISQDDEVQSINDPIFDFRTSQETLTGITPPDSLLDIDNTVEIDDSLSPISHPMLGNTCSERQIIISSTQETTNFAPGKRKRPNRDRSPRRPSGTHTQVKNTTKCFSKRPVKISYASSSASDN